MVFNTAFGAAEYIRLCAFFEIKATAAKSGRFKFIACFENGCSV